MKILVLSDSHGNIDNMIRAVERESPRAIFHLAGRPAAPPAIPRAPL